MTASVERTLQSYGKLETAIYHNPVTLPRVRGSIPRVSCDFKNKAYRKKSMSTAGRPIFAVPSRIYIERRVSQIL